MDRRIFPDISNYTNRYQAHAVATAGALVVGILATDGANFYSPKHAEQATRSHEFGIPVWHYHFCRPEAHPDGQGEIFNFWRHTRPHFKAGDRLALDVEETHPGGWPALRDYVEHLDKMLHHTSGIHELTYLPDSMYRELAAVGLSTLADEYWIASWGGKVRRLGGRRKMIAQQISNGKEGSEPFSYPGIGACDTNRLQRWYARGLERDRKHGKRHG